MRAESAVSIVGANLPLIPRPGRRRSPKIVSTVLAVTLAPLYLLPLIILFALMIVARDAAHVVIHLARKV